MIYKIFLVFFFLNLAVFPQSNDSLYYFTVDVGAGYSHYITTLDMDDLNQSGIGGLFRILWHPEHLLSVGLETGYYNLYSVESTIDVVEVGASVAEVSMLSIPIMVVYSMRIFPNLLPGFALKASSGMLLLYNSFSAYGEERTTSLISIGYSAAGTYFHPLSKVFSIGGEIKYLYISKIQDADLSLQFVLRYRFLSW